MLSEISNSFHNILESSHAIQEQATLSVQGTASCLASIVSTGACAYSYDAQSIWKMEGVVQDSVSIAPGQAHLKVTSSTF